MLFLKLEKNDICVKFISVETISWQELGAQISLPLKNGVVGFYQTKIIFLKNVAVKNIFLKTYLFLCYFRSPLYAHFENTYLGLPTIRAFSGTDLALERFFEYLNDNVISFLL